MTVRSTRPLRRVGTGSNYPNECGNFSNHFDGEFVLLQELYDDSLVVFGGGRCDGGEYFLDVGYEVEYVGESGDK